MSTYVARHRGVLIGRWAIVAAAESPEHAMMAVAAENFRQGKSQIDIRVFTQLQSAEEWAEFGDN